MSLTEFAIKNQVVTWLAVALLIIAGWLSYETLGKLEDPEFTIKTAAIVTEYRGAGPEQVEREVTDRIEIALQEIPEIDYIESLSRAGLSIVKVEIKSQYWSDKLPQIWDTLRRKIRNVEGDLPQGASRPEIRDDYGDVYGFVLAVTGDGFDYKDLEYETKNLKRKLSLVDGVSRVEFWGKRPRAIYLQVRESRLAEAGVTPNDIARTLNLQNGITPSGNIYYDTQSARIDLSGTFFSIDDIANLSIRPAGASPSAISNDEQIKIRDIADVREEFIEPSLQIMRYNDQPAIGLAIANVPGTNVVALGQRLEAKLNTLQAQTPIGITVHKVSWQAGEVSRAINAFIISLIEALAIVLVVLTLAMGWRMGIVIGTALVLTIFGTFVLMSLLGIDLQRLSLGALIIAMGMMVDNSIVVGDGILARLRQGMDREKAALEASLTPSWPLLGATIIAVLAFYPIGGSTESVGEYCLSLFQVVGISLLLSWVISMTVTPLQCMALLKVKDTQTGNLYQAPVYHMYRAILEKALRFRIVTLGGMTVLLIFSGGVFQFIPQIFFPDSARAQFMVDMYAQTGTRVSHTAELLKKAEEKISQMDGVESVSSFIGSGPPRFYLPVEPELNFTSYGQLIVNVDEQKKINGLVAQIDPWLKENFPDVPTFRTRKYSVGPGNTWKFELRILAPEGASLDEIRALGQTGLDMIKDHPYVADARLDWRERAPKVQLAYNQAEGLWTGVSRSDVAASTQRAFDGLPVGQFREGDELRPVLLRNISNERDNPSALYTVQVPEAYSGETVPLSQLVDEIALEWEDPIIWRRNRLRMIRIEAEPAPGVTLQTLKSSVQDQFDQFERNLPEGYSMEWGAEAESSADSQKSLIPGIIPAIIAMFFIIVVLFNALRPALIIFLTIPLAVIGISLGLLFTGSSFGFMALLGALSLAGMMIKNAIVLLDEIQLNVGPRGQSAYDAIVNAGMSRLNPVAMAAGTTVLGVLPLIPDVFWTSMGVVIMAGLSFGTILTLIVVPVLYSLFYGVTKDT